MDDQVDGLRRDFEKAVALLLPTDPVENKKKCAHAEISGTEPVYKNKRKKAKGKTGVELRYYKYSEFKKLSKVQRDELAKLREEMGGNGKETSNTESDADIFSKKKKIRVIQSVVSAVVQHLKDEEDNLSSTIDAIAGILKSSKTSSATHTVGSKKGGVRRPSTKQVTPDNQTETEVAAIKLFKIIQSISVPGEKGKST